MKNLIKMVAIILTTIVVYGVMKQINIPAIVVEIFLYSMGILMVILIGLHLAIIQIRRIEKDPADEERRHEQDGEDWSAEGKRSCRRRKRR